MSRIASCPLVIFRAKKKRELVATVESSYCVEEYSCLELMSNARIANLSPQQRPLGDFSVTHRS